MPRELVLLSPTQMIISTLAEAVAAAHPGLAVTLSTNGLLASVFENEERLVTFVHPRRLHVPSEVGRLLPALPDDAPEPQWWIDALVPWGEAERRGVLVAAALATSLGATMYDPLGGRGATQLGD
jgi:hypothetical protein